MLRALSRWKWLFLVLSGLLIIGLIVSRVVGPGETPGEPAVTISPREAADHVGVRADVCGEVAEVTHATGIGGQPTFINLERAHPNQPFTAVIWGEDRPLWDVPPEQQYADREICVRGRINLHDDTPQIAVSTPRQIRVQE